MTGRGCGRGVAAGPRRRRQSYRSRRGRRSIVGHEGDGGRDDVDDLAGGLVDQLDGAAVGAQIVETKHALGFGEKCVELKPVQRLRYCHQRNSGGRQRTRFTSRNKIVHMGLAFPNESQFFRRLGGPRYREQEASLPSLERQ